MICYCSPLFHPIISSHYLIPSAQFFHPAPLSQKAENTLVKDISCNPVPKLNVFSLILFGPVISLYCPNTTSYSVVFLILDSSSRLYPSHPLFSPPDCSASIMVSILASVLSAKLRANASKSAGFFGDPYSNSP